MLARVIAFIVVGSLASTAFADVTFDREVMSVLAKAGCNLGTCHGNLNGKGGFKLSLRGADAAFDYASLTRSQSGRRVNLTDPEASLLLLKPLMNVPHEGGRRFNQDSPEYRILRDWIAGGARRQTKVARVTQLDVEPRDVVLTDPTETVQLRVTATYADGSQADVSRLAVYEPAEPVVEVGISGLVRRQDFAQTVVVVRYLDQQVPVRVAFISSRPDFVWNGPAPTNAIDEHVFRRLQVLRMNPSAICDDVTFLRRASLDLTGQLPSPRDAKEFVASTASDKRTKLVEELLGRPEFAEFWTQKWADLLRVEEQTLDRKGVETFHAWIRNSVATNKPIDQFVREIVSARGSSYSNPPTNFYRAMRKPDMRGESTAQLFLGLRLQCAKCHNHPFDQWTQADYYGWGNLFGRVDYELLGNERRDKNNLHEFNGEQVIWQTHAGDFSFPDGHVVAPRFLGASSDSKGGKGPGRDRLHSLAQWLTAPTNRRFVEVSVNRVWHQLLGRGLVDPIDDFRSTNPPSHPELLTELASEFVKHDFDMQWLIRAIMAAQTYQLSSEPNDTNRDDSRNYSHAQPRRLSAEQLTDAISNVTGVAIEFDGYPRGTKAIQLSGVRGLRTKRGKADDGAQFMSLFGKPPRLTTCECERSSETTLAQAFQLVSGPLLNELLTDRNNRLSRWLSSNQTPDELVADLYWLTLSRAPQAVELKTSKRLLSESSDRRRTLEDIVWAMMNSDEFLLRR